MAVAVERIALTQEDARRLTDEVREDAAALWAKLLALYEGDAHVALGYPSWGQYCEAEFQFGKSRGYQLLDSARVVALLADSTIVESPSSEGVARELVPLRKQPEQMREAWSDAVDRFGPHPTAEQVRDIITPRTRGQLANQSGGTDEWATPQPLFDALNAEFGFDLDVCALPSSAKCDRYFTPETDGLAQEWSGACWMNPPYGDEIPRWIAKAAESAAAGATVVALVPARVETAWWWNHCRHAEIRFLRGRLRFGDSPNSAPFPSAVVVFGRDPRVVWWEWGR